MKLTYRMTLDSLLRALRGRAHQLADDVEHGYSSRPAGARNDKRRTGASAARRGGRRVK